MLHHALSVAILALVSTSFANPIEKREIAANQAQFTAAANNLIASYIPSSILTDLASAVASAASAASVNGDPQSLLTSALEANPRPTWLSAAVPSAYTNQVAALENAIDALRPPPEIVITALSTDAAGAIVTSIHTTTVPTVAIVDVLTITTSGSTLTTTIHSAVSISTLSPTTQQYTTTGVDTLGSSFTSTISTVISTLAPAPLTASAVLIIETTTNSLGSTYTTSFASISTGLQTSSTTSTNLAPAPSGLGRSAAGVLALVGLVVAL